MTHPTTRPEAVEREWHHGVVSASEYSSPARTSAAISAATSVSESSPLSSSESSSESASTHPDAPGQAQHVIIRTDAEPAVGVGHAMRMLALAQELTSRDVRCTLVGRLSVEWVAQLYREAGLDVVEPPQDADAFVTLVQQLAGDAVVLDRYTLGPTYGTALRAAGIRTMAVVDAAFGADQVADIYLDQNPGAQPHPTSEGEVALAGAPYTLFRDSVLSQRRDTTTLTAHNSSEPLRVLAVFGGTDPFGAGEVIVPLLLATGLDVDVTVVRPEGARELTFTPATERQNVRQVPPLNDLPASALAADLVITAAGSSVWELMCLGAPLGVVCVVDNQVPGYRQTMSMDVAYGVAVLDEVRTDEQAQTETIRVLHEALTDATGRRAQAIRAQQMLDGRGRQRVADVLLGRTVTSG